MSPFPIDYNALRTPLASRSWQLNPSNCVHIQYSFRIDYNLDFHIFQKNTPSSPRSFLHAHMFEFYAIKDLFYSKTAFYSTWIVLPSSFRYFHTIFLNFNILFY